MYHLKLMAMSQLGGTLGNTAVRVMPYALWRFSSLPLNSGMFSSDAAAESAKVISDNKVELPSEQPDSEVSRTLKLMSSNMGPNTVHRIKKSLMKVIPEGCKTATLINSANTVSDILNITKYKDVSTTEVMRIISAVSHSVQKQKEIRDGQELQDGENIVLNLLKSVKTSKEMARLENLPLTYYIQILVLLRVKKNRDTMILTEVVNQMTTRYNEFSTKESMDILFSLSSLNFPAEKLINKVASQLIEKITENEAKFIMESISTSIGMLRYRNEDLLKRLCSWTLEKCNTLRPRHLLTFTRTLAMLDYKNDDAITIIRDRIHLLEYTDMSGMSEWIDLVWSLTVLDEVLPKHLSSVLHKDFIGKLLDINISPVKFLKVLNINAAAKVLRKDYEGPLLDEESPVYRVSSVLSKDKSIAFIVLAETLRNVFPSTSYYKINVNTNMGFFIGAECTFDKRHKAVPVEKINSSGSEAVRIAVIKYEYKDYCIGDNHLNGMNKLHERLLSGVGYKILRIPHHCFHKSDKLIERTQYINDNLKLILSDLPS